MKIILSILFYLSSLLLANAQTKILFDATKAETAGNADWVIDVDAHNLGYSGGPAQLNGALNPIHREFRLPPNPA